MKMIKKLISGHFASMTEDCQFEGFVGRVGKEVDLGANSPLFDYSSDFISFGEQNKQFIDGNEYKNKTVTEKKRLYQKFIFEFYSNWQVHSKLKKVISELNKEYIIVEELRKFSEIELIISFAKNLFDFINRASINVTGVMQPDGKCLRDIAQKTIAWSRTLKPIPNSTEEEFYIARVEWIKKKFEEYLVEIYVDAILLKQFELSSYIENFNETYHVTKAPYLFLKSTVLPTVIALEKVLFHQFSAIEKMMVQMLIDNRFTRAANIIKELSKKPAYQKNIVLLFADKNIRCCLKQKDGEKFDWENSVLNPNHHYHWVLYLNGQSRAIEEIEEYFLAQKNFSKEGLFKITEEMKFPLELICDRLRDYKDIVFLRLLLDEEVCEQFKRCSEEKIEQNNFLKKAKAAIYSSFNEFSNNKDHWLFCYKEASKIIVILAKIYGEIFDKNDLSMMRLLTNPQLMNQVASGSDNLQKISNNEYLELEEAYKKIKNLLRKNKDENCDIVSNPLNFFHKYHWVLYPDEKPHTLKEIEEHFTTQKIFTEAGLLDITEDMRFALDFLGDQFSIDSWRDIMLLRLSVDENCRSEFKTYSENKTNSKDFLIKEKIAIYRKFNDFKNGNSWVSLLLNDEFLQYAKKKRDEIEHIKQCSKNKLSAYLNEQEQFIQDCLIQNNSQSYDTYIDFFQNNYHFVSKENPAHHSSTMTNESSKGQALSTVFLTTKERENILRRYFLRKFAGIYLNSLERLWIGFIADHKDAESRYQNFDSLMRQTKNGEPLSPQFLMNCYSYKCLKIALSGNSIESEWVRELEKYAQYIPIELALHNEGLLAITPQMEKTIDDIEKENQYHFILEAEEILLLRLVLDSQCREKFTTLAENLSDSQNALTREKIRIYKKFYECLQDATHWATCLFMKENFPKWFQITEEIELAKTFFKQLNGMSSVELTQETILMIRLAVDGECREEFKQASEQEQSQDPAIIAKTAFYKKFTINYNNVNHWLWQLMQGKRFKVFSDNEREKIAYIKSYNENKRGLYLDMQRRFIDDCLENNKNELYTTHMAMLSEYYIYVQGAYVAPEFYSTFFKDADDKVIQRYRQALIKYITQNFSPQQMNSLEKQWVIFSSDPEYAEAKYGNVPLLIQQTEKEKPLNPNYLMCCYFYKLFKIALQSKENQYQWIHDVVKKALDLRITITVLMKVSAAFSQFEHEQKSSSLT